MRNLWNVEALNRPLRNHCDRIATVLQADVVNRGGTSTNFAAAAGSIIPSFDPYVPDLFRKRIDGRALGRPGLLPYQCRQVEVQIHFFLCITRRRAV